MEMETKTKPIKNTSILVAASSIKYPMNPKTHAKTGVKFLNNL
ncbi:hypothetical protein LLT5_07505 [Lactococcus cremoris subsp. cremoris TIFN5]|nr:hypothetical protein LLT5_07505 [Lactococcus cremoris subsp. cremoris TIFN5]EQC87658.1 hypothetical protein LLT1_09555 [Lactococcus cremoris subsp. cremoris TIFN1]